MSRTAGQALLFDPADPRAIGQAIEYLLTHPVEAMARRDREAVGKVHNWSSQEKRLPALRREVLSNDWPG